MARVTWRSSAGRLVFAAVLAASIGVAAQRTPNPATHRERRERAMQAARDGIVLIRAQPALAQESETQFHQDSTFYYLTGVYNAVGALLALDVARHETWLFVPEPGQLPGLGAVLQPPYGYIAPGAQTAAELGIDHVLPWTEFEGFIDGRLREEPAIVLRGPFRPESRLRALRTLIGQDRTTAWEMVLRSRWPNARFDPAPAIAQLRDVKDAEEIQTLRRVGESSAAALRKAISVIRPGVRQREVEAEVMSACVRGGAAGVSFWPWIMSGPNSDTRMAARSLADYAFADRVMQSGELARVDIGCSQEYYAGDVGRTVPVSGRFTPEQREAWGIFVHAYEVARRYLSPGRTPADVKAAWQADIASQTGRARSDVARHLVAAAQSPDGMQFWQIHGVGLDSAETPPDTFRPGQVVALEPMVLVDGLGFYMEDMLLVTASGADVLTPGLPYSADELERAMRRGRR